MIAINEELTDCTGSNLWTKIENIKVGMKVLYTSKSYANLSMSTVHRVHPTCITFKDGGKVNISYSQTNRIVILQD